MTDETESRMLAAAAHASPSSATRMAAPELWNDEAIRLLPRLVGRDIPPRRLLRIRHSATTLAAERESERTTPAIGSIASTDPWRLKKKMCWARLVSAPESEMSPSLKGSPSRETHPSTPAL